MTSSKVTPIRAHKGGTPAYRAIADQVIATASNKAFNVYFEMVAEQHPGGSTDLAAKAFVAALRSNLEWFERAEERRAQVTKAARS
jgi:tripartite-type tricarboxylate transporter receptor subunit TctC